MSAVSSTTEGRLTKTAMLTAAQQGAITDLSTGVAALDDPARGAEWGDDRTVDADVLRAVLTEPAAPRAVVLRGARIAGALNLEAAKLLCPLNLQACFLEGPVNLREADAPVVRQLSCHVDAIDAEQLVTRGDLGLRGIAASTISVREARIGGDLDLSGAKLRGGQTPIGLGPGTLNPPLNGARDTPEDNVALLADGLRCEQDVLCGDGFFAEGKVRLIGARIEGSLRGTGAWIKTSGCALDAQGLTVNGSVCLDRCEIDGELRLTRAYIGGGLSLDSATLTNPEGRSVMADRLRVGQSLSAETAEAESGHELPSFEAQGEFRMINARIEGQLKLNGARLIGSSRALTADGMTVGGDMFCRDFHAQGEVRLLGAQIGEQLSFERATLETGANAAPPVTAGAEHEELSLKLREARVGTSLWIQPASTPPAGVDLRGASLATVYDAEHAWPARVWLRGCTYERLVLKSEAPAATGRLTRLLGRLAGQDPEVKARLKWLRSDPEGFSPGPYEQLRAAYRRSGHDAAARQVAIARERQRRTTLPWIGRQWNRFLSWTVGHGYAPWKAGLWLAGFLALGTVVFAHLHPADLTPAKDPGPEFQPAIYTLDLLVPVFKLGQDDAWIAHHAAQWWVLAFTIAGWALTTALVAGFTGNLKRD